jgi:pyruvate/2-oxoglutarate dehydrogenase complex dihydrolipoamide acyltransferase (E2) component
MSKIEVDVTKRLEIQDLPRDRTRATGALRSTLCSVVNYCKRYPAKLALVKEILDYTVAYVDAAVEASKKPVEQAEAEPVQSGQAPVEPSPVDLRSLSSVVDSEPDEGEPDPEPIQEPTAVSASKAAEELAAANGIDLTKVTGTGTNGQITKPDVVKAIAG